jgi:hypothetical protein
MSLELRKVERTNEDIKHITNKNKIKLFLYIFKELYFNTTLIERILVKMIKTVNLRELNGSKDNGLNKIIMNSKVIKITFSEKFNSFIS